MSAEMERVVEVNNSEVQLAKEFVDYAREVDQSLAEHEKILDDFENFLGKLKDLYDRNTLAKLGKWIKTDMRSDSVRMLDEELVRIFNREIGDAVSWDKNARSGEGGPNAAERLRTVDDIIIAEFRAIVDKVATGKGETMIDIAKEDDGSYEKVRKALVEYGADADKLYDRIIEEYDLNGAQKRIKTTELDAVIAAYEKGEDPFRVEASDGKTTAAVTEAEKKITIEREHEQKEGPREKPGNTYYSDDFMSEGGRITEEEAINLMTKKQKKLLAKIKDPTKRGEKQDEIVGKYMQALVKLSDGQVKKLISLRNKPVVRKRVLREMIATSLDGRKEKSGGA